MDKVWEDNDLVFCTGTGTKLDTANVRRQFKVITKAASLGQDWTPQELRHTFVSVMSASGVPERPARARQSPSACANEPGASGAPLRAGNCDPLEQQLQWRRPSR